MSRRARRWWVITEIIDREGNVTSAWVSESMTLAQAIRTQDLYRSSTTVHVHITNEAGWVRPKRWMR